MSAFKQRYLASYIEEDLQKKMVFLGGPRQVGKTALGLHLSEQFKHPLYLNWDSTPHRERILKSKWPVEIDFILLDEIHKYDSWKRWIKGIWDTRLNYEKIMVTGSSKLDVYRRGGDSLLGRYHYYHLHPFSLAEINRVDLKVRNAKQEIIIIEVQYEREFDYLQRILFGASKVITEHIQENEPYSKVIKVISVNILYFDLGQGEDYVYLGKTISKGIHQHDELRLSPNQQILYEKEQIHELFPEYYLIKVNSFNDIAKDSLDEWIYFLKNEEIKEDFNAKGIKRAKEELDILKLPKQEQIAYNKYQEDLHYQASIVESSYGLGKKQGIEQGIEQGMVKGEKQKAMEIAKNLIDILDTETIAKNTGLSIAEVEKIEKQKG